MSHPLEYKVMVSDSEKCLLCLLDISVSALGECLFKSFAHFLNRVIFCCRASVYSKFNLTHKII